MKIHPVVTQANGVISVTLQATFVGDPSDGTDKAKIAAFGDPLVNLAGNFTDPNNNAFTFQFPTTELFVGLTAQMSGYTARFMVALPGQPSQPGTVPPTQGPLDVITPNPSEAAQAWVNVIAGLGPSSRIGQAMSQLRSMIIVPPIADVTI